LKNFYVPAWFAFQSFVAVLRGTAVSQNGTFLQALTALNYSKELAQISAFDLLKRQKV
jgi:hypothetical protein